MSVTRVSDAQLFSLLSERAGQLQAQIADLQAQVASGQRLTTPDQDPIAAGQVVRFNADLAALTQYGSASRFGSDVLGAQDKALGDAEQIMVRADEIATQQASGLLGPGERQAAAEEVHGLLQALTAIGNTELAGRRIFAGLAAGPPPFADPDSAGYDPSTAYSGATEAFYLKTGSSPTDRVRLTTAPQVAGTAVTTTFTGSLVALQDLETKLRTNVDVTSTLTALAQGRDDITTEQASVGAREAQLVGRVTQLSALQTANQGARSRLQDADLVGVVSQLSQAQTALQALLAAGGQLVQTSLVDLLHV